MNQLRARTMCPTCGDTVPEIGRLLDVLEEVLLELRRQEWARGQLRHLFKNMIEGRVSDAEEAALGLLGPAIEELESSAEEAIRKSES